MLDGQQSMAQVLGLLVVEWLTSDHCRPWGTDPWAEDHSHFRSITLSSNSGKQCST